MIGETQLTNGVDSSKYENFGLYPFSTLQDIVTQFESGEFKDSNGHELVESDAFQKLERMAFDPPIPDPVTATVASIIHYLEDAGYKDKAGRELSSSPAILSLKQMNVRRLFKEQSEDGLRLLSILEGLSYHLSTGAALTALKDDIAFHDLRRIIVLEGREGQDENAR